MKLKLALCAAGLLAGCAGSSGPVGDSPRKSGAPEVRETPKLASETARDVPVAVVNGRNIAREQLVKPLVETYGLNLLLMMIRLELVNQELEKQHMQVVPSDVGREREFILNGAFPDANPKDYDQLLVQLLKQQNITLVQWEILLKTNAGLRKIAEPLCAGKITEENIQQAFDLKYGAQVKIRDIQVSNIAAAQNVKKRLAAGEKFEDVARTASQDARTAPLGGELPAFSANSTAVNDLIKEQAFGLKVGEVSDALNTGTAFHIIKVEQRIPPTIAKLDEPTRQYLRNALMERLVQQYVRVLMAQMAEQIKDERIVQIEDPVLKKQLEQMIEAAKSAAREEEKARQLEAARRANAATQPASTEARERPPATKSVPAPTVPDGLGK